MIGLFRPPNQRLTLRQSLGRTHLVTSLTAVCMAGVLLTGIALLALRLYADHNLELVARAISYTSEAAVVFHDEEAAREALQAITTHEDVARASKIRLRLVIVHDDPHRGTAPPAGEGDEDAVSIGRPHISVDLAREEPLLIAVPAALLIPHEVQNPVIGLHHLIEEYFPFGIHEGNLTNSSGQ